MSLQQKHFFWFWRNLIFWPSFTIFHNIHQLFWPNLYNFDYISQALFTYLIRCLNCCVKRHLSSSQQVIENSAQNWWSMLRGSGEPDSSPNRTGTFSTSTYWWFQQPIMEMRCDVLVFILFCQKNGRKKTFDQHLFKTSGDQRKALHRLWAASQFLEVFAVLRSCLLESRNRYQGASLRIKFIQKYFISFPSPSFSPP